MEPDNNSTDNNGSNGDDFRVVRRIDDWSQAIMRQPEDDSQADNSDSSTTAKSNIPKKGGPEEAGLGAAEQPGKGGVRTESEVERRAKEEASRRTSYTAPVASGDRSSSSNSEVRQESRSSTSQPAAAADLGTNRNALNAQESSPAGNSPYRQQPTSIPDPITDRLLGRDDKAQEEAAVGNPVKVSVTDQDGPSPSGARQLTPAEKAAQANAAAQDYDVAAKPLIDDNPFNLPASDGFRNHTFTDNSSSRSPDQIIEDAKDELRGGPSPDRIIEDAKAGLLTGTDQPVSDWERAQAEAAVGNPVSVTPNHHNEDNPAHLNTGLGMDPLAELSARLDYNARELMRRFPEMYGDDFNKARAQAEVDFQNFVGDIESGKSSDDLAKLEDHLNKQTEEYMRKNPGVPESEARYRVEDEWNTFIKRMDDRAAEISRETGMSWDDARAQADREFNDFINTPNAQAAAERAQQQEAQEQIDAAQLEYGGNAWRDQQQQKLEADKAAAAANSVAVDYNVGQQPSWVDPVGQAQQQWQQEQEAQKQQESWQQQPWVNQPGEPWVQPQEPPQQSSSPDPWLEANPWQEQPVSTPAPAITTDPAAPINTNQDELPPEVLKAQDDLARLEHALNENAQVYVSQGYAPHVARAMADRDWENFLTRPNASPELAQLDEALDKNATELLTSGQASSWAEARAIADTNFQNFVAAQEAAAHEQRLQQIAANLPASAPGVTPENAVDIAGALYNSVPMDANGNVPW